MNIKDLLTLQNLYVQIKTENPDFVGINFREGQIQISHEKITEVAPLKMWKVKEDETHTFFSYTDENGVNWSACTKNETVLFSDLALAPAATARFVDGEVDYASGGDGRALEEIY